MQTKKAKRIAKTICYIDRETKAVTAGVNFEDIDLRIEDEGSEVYDYEYHFILHSQTVNGQVYFENNNLASYSRDYMRGSNSTAQADSSTGLVFSGYAQAHNSSYTSMVASKISGYTGNKRHIDGLRSISSSTATRIEKDSYYTSDTSTELTSMQLYFTQTATITYSLFITAVPKVQYNPNAILLKNLDLSSQTADIIFGGVNDTEGVDDLDGDVYDYYYKSNLDKYCILRVNEIATATRNEQRMNNSNGSISSVNYNNTYEAYIENGEALIQADTGRKKLTTYTHNSDTYTTDQTEGANWDQDTSTKMTSLQLVFSEGSTSGNIQLYAVPKNKNADLTPWKFEQTIDIAGDFSAGHSFEIPSWACLMEVDFAGGSSSNVDFELDFNSLGVAIDRQYLLSVNASTCSIYAS